MKRTDSRVIKRPTFANGDSELLNEEELEEANLRMFDYARRTAIPTLEDYIIDPFKSAVKERVFREAVEEVGLDEEGIINDPYAREVLLDGHPFKVTVSASSRVAYEPVLSRFKHFLDTIRSDKEAGISRDSIRRHDDHMYIALQYLTDTLAQYTKETTTRFNKKDLSAPEKDVEQLRVYLDMNRYTKLNTKNAQEFAAACGLRRRLIAFNKSFESMLEKRYLDDIKEPLEFDFELSDDTAVRYLFFPKPSIEYGKMYAALVGKQTKSISGSTGDFDIIAELAFKDPYENKRGRITVATCGDDNDGKIVIERLDKEGNIQASIYKLLQNEEKTVYVKADDITERLDFLESEYTSTVMHFKVDFYAAPPQHL